jgi:hypothetical protein
MPNKVFISYRREDSKYQARRIYDAFEHALPPGTVFMDVDTIPPGADFVEILEGWVQQCDVLLALIGPNWLGSIDPRTDLRRLDNPEDFVRIEVRGALERKIPVVPVLLDSTEMPTAAELPDDIKALRRRHAEFVDFRTFDADVQRLIKRLKIGKKAELPGEAPGPQAADNSGRTTAVATPNTFFQRTKPKSPLLAAAMALLVVVGAAAAVYVTSAAPRVDASAGLADFAKSEEGRRTAEARASQAADALAVAEKARQEAEAKAAEAAAALVKTEESRRAAEARANDAAEAVKKSDKARLDAEARADNSRQLAEVRANDAAEALKKSEKARQEAEAKVAALTKAEELRKTADARPSPAPPPPAIPPAAGSQPSSSRKLLADIGGKSRWAMDGSMCNNTKDANFLSLEVGNGSVTWVSGLGKVETETILDSTENGFRTRSSQQLLGYSRHGESSIYVQSSKGASFVLERCP